MVATKRFLKSRAIWNVFKKTKLWSLNNSFADRVKTYIFFDKKKQFANVCQKENRVIDECCHDWRSQTERIMWRKK